MSVALERYEPVLEPSLRVIHELVRTGEADIEVPIRFPEAVGLAVDIDKLVYRLNPHIDREIIIPKEIRIKKLFGKKSEGIVNKRLKIKFTESDFLILSDQLFSRALLDIKPEEKPQSIEKSKISVTAHDAGEYRFQKSPIVDLLKENGIRFPSSRNKIVLNFKHHSMQGIYFPTIFQEFSHLEIFQREDKYITSYPVSCTENHLLPFCVWDCISKPLFWNSWSVYELMSFLVLTGKKTIEGLAKENFEDLNHFKSHMEKAIPICYEIMETLIEHQSFDPLLEKLKVPKEYRGIFLAEPTRLFFSIANPDSLQNNPEKYTQLKNLIDTYNREYALPKGKRAVSIEEVANFKLIKYNKL